MCLLVCPHKLSTVLKQKRKHGSHCRRPSQGHRETLAWPLSVLKAGRGWGWYNKPLNGGIQWCHHQCLLPRNLQEQRSLFSWESHLMAAWRCLLSAGVTDKRHACHRNAESGRTESSYMWTIRDQSYSNSPSFIEVLFADSFCHLLAWIT